MRNIGLKVDSDIFVLKWNRLQFWKTDLITQTAVLKLDGKRMRTEAEGSVRKGYEDNPTSEFI